MLDRKKLDDLAAAVNRVLPRGLTEDVSKNVRAALKAGLERLDLVTREELEVQEAVLARTRQKLEELEKKLATLEEQLKKH
ncbi:MAG: accessory factor UbiK family protein [Acidiferrobacterales bacterium]